MKKPLKYFFVFAFVIIATASQAQEFFVGFKGGLQYYTMRYSEEESRAALNNKGKLGYKVGGTIIFPLADDFFFGSELYYSRKGRKYVYEETTVNNATYNFIEFSGYLRKSYPIQFSENTYPGNWFFNVGPNVMRWVNGHGTLSDAASLEYDVIFSEAVDSDFNKNYISEANRWLFGLDFGAGINFRTRKNENVFIELRYTHGHTFFGGNYSESVISVLGFQDDLRAQYRVFHLSVAYLFDVNVRNLRKGKSTIKRR